MHSTVRNDVSRFLQTWYIPDTLHGVIGRNLIFIMTAVGKQVNLLLLLILLIIVCFLFAIRRSSFLHIAVAVVLCCVLLCCVVLFCVLLCCVVLFCCVVFRCVLLCCLCCVLLCCVFCVVFCFVVLCFVVFCFVVFCCVVLCCVYFWRLPLQVWRPFFGGGVDGVWGWRGLIRA